MKHSSWIVGYFQFGNIKIQPHEQNHKMPCHGGQSQGQVCLIINRPLCLSAKTHNNDDQGVRQQGEIKIFAGIAPEGLPHGQAQPSSKPGDASTGGSF
ncbi:MAG TPA: hypothetical protein ENN39_02305 [Desulfonatronum sp.]|nr:hypothetical protein [Desulfonatronum sp.]